MEAPRPHIDKAIRAEWNAYQACTTQGPSIPYPYPEGQAMDVVRLATRTFLQKKAAGAIGDTSVDDGVSLFFGPHHVSCAMSVSRSKPFMTILQGCTFLVLPGAAMFNLKDASQVQALLKYRKWKEIVFAEALTAEFDASNTVDLPTLIRELNATQASTPLSVITVGASSRIRPSPLLSTRSRFQGASLWAVVKEARREMPNLRISLFDADPLLDVLQLAACHPADGKDYVCHRGMWEASNMAQMSTEVPRPFPNVFACLDVALKFDDLHIMKEEWKLVKAS